MAKNKKQNKANLEPESILPEKVIKQRRTRVLEKQDMITFFKKVLVICFAIFLVIRYIYGIQVIEGQSMYPAIKDGDVVLFFRLDKDININDIVAADVNGSRFISRVVARGGDTIDLSDDGELIINGNVQQEEIYFLTYPEQEGITFPYTVSQNCVFILGDLRTSAIDSRNFGEINLNNVEGKVMTIIRRRGF